MKAYIINTLLFSLSILITVPAVCQDNTPAIVNACHENVPTGSVFVKTYEIKPKQTVENDAERSYVFTKDLTYTISICKQAPNLKIKILDANRVEVASNINDKTLLPTFDFKCESTGLYYLAFSFDNFDNAGASMILAFKR